MPHLPPAPDPQPSAPLGPAALQHAIFHSANFSSIATDAQGVIQIFNVGAERKLGYTAAEVVNRITPADLSDPIDLAHRAAALSEEFGRPIAQGFEALVFKASRGIEDHYELTQIRKDGSRFPAVLSVTALRDPTGQIIGYLLIGTDNTARKAVEEERSKLDKLLRRQEQYTRSLFEANLDALMTVDAHGRVTDLNKQMCTLTGFTRAQLVGAPFRGCFTDPERAASLIPRVLEELQVTDFELRISGTAEVETPVSCNACSLIDAEGALQGVFIAARDITERARLDAALQSKHEEVERARDAADKANRAKSDFLSSMSHELRSPLNAILGFAQLMDSDTPPPTKSQKESIEQVLRAGWYLLELINEILDLAVIESGKLALSLEPVSVGEVIRECSALMAQQGHQRALSVHFPEFDAPVYVRADRVRLKQVVVNLLSNAIKYNRPGGGVHVSVSAVESAPDRVRLQVRDTGVGIAAMHLGALFQPFNRLGQAGGPEEGTGIGLVVSKMLVDLMGGVIGVESSAGVGSAFWVDLTAAQAPEVHHDPLDTLTPATAPAPPGTPIRTILCVEDNLANLRLVERLIGRRPDLRLVSAVDGQTGLALARAHRPAVILMDIHLPGISGLQALDLLRADPSTASIPVIAVSANAMTGDVSTGLKSGFFRYLTKPIDVQTFMATLDEALAVSAGAPAHFDLQGPPR